MKLPLSLFFFFVVLIGKINLAHSEENRRLVLVTDASSGISSLNDSQARRLFLGLTVIVEGHPLEAAINHSDPFLYEVFLQRVVHMSSAVYERHLMTNAIQLGGQRPQTFNDTRSLIHALREFPGTVSLLWLNDAKHNSGLKILGEVWHGTVE